MRTFGADFATEIATDNPELFITAAFYFTSARGTIYVSDRPITVGGIAHLPIVPREPSGWGELSSVFDRLTTSVDVQQVTLTFSNYPLTAAEAALFPGQLYEGLRWSDILHAEAEATEVDFWWTVRRASDGATFKEKAFRGVIQGPPAWSYETATCKLYSLYEKYLTGDALSTIDPKYNRFCRPSDQNATRPKALGNVPRAIGRVVKGRLISEPISATANNAASGQLTEATVDLEALYAKCPSSLRYRALAFTATILFTSSLNFSFSSAISHGSGTITEDFATDDDIFHVASGAWEGIFFAGDEFFFDVDTGNSLIEFSEIPATATWGGIDTVYANGVGIDTTDIRLAADGGATHQISGPDATPPVGTYVIHDGLSGGHSEWMHLYGQLSAPSDPDGRPVSTSIVFPFTVPDILTSGHLIQVAFQIYKFSNTVAPIYASVLDSFHPFGIGYNSGGMSLANAAEDLAAPPGGLGLDFSTSPPSPQSATSDGSGEAYLARSASIMNANVAGFASYTLHWFQINVDLIPGRQYWMMLAAEAWAADQWTTNQFYYVSTVPIDEFNPVYITPPPPAKSIATPANRLFGQAYHLNADVGAWTPISSTGAHSGEAASIACRFLYSGTVFTSNPESGFRYQEQLRLNRGIIATDLGLIVGPSGSGPVEGTVTVNLKAAETTGEAREIVGSISMSAADLAGLDPGRQHGITKPLPRPVIVRPGFYQVEVIGEVDVVTRRIVGWTIYGSNTYTPVPHNPEFGVAYLFSGGGRKPVVGIEGTSLSLAIIIKAAKLTREVAVDVEGKRVARVAIDTWLPDEWIMTADLRGLTLSGSKQADAISHMLLNDAGVEDEWIDLAGTFTASATEYASRGYVFDGLVLEQQTWKDLLFRLAFECRSIFDWSVDKARLKFIPDGPTTADATIAYADTVARGVVPEVTVTHTDPSKILNFIDLLYRRKYQDGRGDEWQSKLHDQDNRSIGVYGRREEKDGTNPFRLLYVRQLRMAADLLGFWLRRYANPRTAITLQSDWLALDIEKDDQMNLSNL